MATIYPTLRENRRYLLFDVVSEQPVAEGEAKHGTYDALISFLGEQGSSLANPKFISFNPEKKELIVRCTAKEMGNVKAALALLTEINGKKAVLRLKNVSGTLKKLSAKKKH